MIFREPTLTWVALYLLALSRCLMISLWPLGERQLEDF
jgi:hypothetical protein